MEQMDIKNYVQIIKKRWWLIVICVVLAYTVTSYYYANYSKPVYRASAKLIVNQYDDTGTNLLPGQINANLLLINTYKEIIPTTVVMERVADQYPELGLSSDQLVNRIRVSSEHNSQVMTLTVTDYEYNQAMRIINSVAAVVKEAIPQIMRVNNVEILETAPPLENPIPLGTDPIVNKIISVIAALMISVALIFLVEFLDDTIRSEKDVLQLELPVIATIVKIKDKDLKQRKRAKKKYKEAPYATVNE